MSMSRADIARHIEQGNFSIFASVPERQQITVANDIVNCYDEAFFLSSNPDKWIEFMKYLSSNSPKYLKMPDFMMGVLRRILFNNSQDAKQSEYCKKFFMAVLNELEANRDFSVEGNKLVRLEGILIFESIHKPLLSLINTMNAAEKKKSLDCLLDRYIARPSLLYGAYLLKGKAFLDELTTITDDKEKLWFIKMMKDMFEHTREADQNTVREICRFLIDTDSNVFPIEGLKEQEKKTLLDLKMIVTHSKKVLDKVEGLIGADKKLDSESLRKLEALRQSQDSEAVLKFTNQMSKFFRSFDNLEHGLREGLLTSAQSASRKKYDYNLVVFEEGNFGAFLDILQNAQKPIRMRFVQTGNHWVTGDIEIDKNGQARMVLFDSLGIGYIGGAFGIYSDTLGVMGGFSQKFPNSPIYLSEDHKQNTPTGCSVYALDDAAHLFNLETHLQKNLFDYFSEQEKVAITIKVDDVPVTYYPSQLPLSLLRNAQTERFYKGAEEQGTDLPDERVNKKGDTFLKSSERFFRSKPGKRAGRMNTRLDYELEKIARQNAEYLLTHDEAAVARETEKFTLESFRQACEAERARSPVDDSQQQPPSAPKPPA